MFKQRPMAFLMPLLVVLSMLISTPAIAQSTQTWMPENFDPAVHSYLDPKLSDSVDLSNCDQELKDAGKVHGYEFYFIMTELDAEPNGSTNGQNFAAWKLDQYVLKVAKNLPAKNYVIVLVVRSRKNPNAHSLAAQGGDQLQKDGFNASWFNAANGTLVKNKTTYLPTNPKGFMLAVAGDVNKATSDLLAARQAEELRKQKEAEAARLKQEKEAQEAQRAAAEAEAHAAFMRVLPFYILGGLLTLLLLLFAVYRQLLKSKALGLVADRRKKLKSSNDFYAQLRRDYHELLMDRKNWRDMFTPAGLTYPQYEKAVDAYSEFTVRNEIANKLADDAEAAIKACPFWSFGGYKQAIAMLETTPIVVSGEEIRLKDVKDIYGGKFRTTTYQPSSLFDSMKELFDTANTGLEKIFTSFKESDQNKLDIERLFNKLEQTRDLLQGNDLVFDPYKTRYDELKAAQSRVLDTIDADPLAAVESTQEVENNIQALDQSLKSAIEFRHRLTTETEPAIAQSESRVKAARSQPVQYLYPLATGESAPESLRGAASLLAEEGGNPDHPLSDAGRHLADALTALRSADLETAAAKKAAAEHSAREAAEVVDKVLETKALVEKQLPPVRKDYDTLAAALPGASTAVTELKAEFLPMNYRGEPEKLDTAVSVANTTGAELNKLKRAYDEQRYLAARDLLEKLNSSISESTEQLKDIHHRLKELRRLKEHSRTTVDAAIKLAVTLADKLKLNSFTTAAETDSAYTRLNPSLENQQAEVQKDIADWPAASTAADQLLASYQQIDRAVDEQKSLHANAEKALETLVSSVNSAAGFVKDPAALQPSLDQLSSAKRTLSDLQTKIGQKKSDWAALARRANEANTVANKAEQLAKTDRRNYDDASTSVKALELAIDSATVYTRNLAARQPALDKLNLAESAFREAKTQLDRPKSDWAAIARRAKDGKTAAVDAENLAKQDRLDYDQAVSEIRSLTTALNSAQISVDDSTTRQPSINKLSAARSTLRDVQDKIRQPRSDWKQIASLAKTALTTANEADMLAQSDRLSYDRAVAAINGASQTVRQSRTQFGSGVTADLGQANGKLRSARTALDAGNYEDAATHAQSVGNLVTVALAAAADAVAQIIAREQAAREQAARDQAVREQAARERMLQDAAEQATRSRSVSQPERQPDNAAPETPAPNRDDSSSGRSGPGVDGNSGRSGKGVGDF
jgi:ferredoxin